MASRMLDSNLFINKWFRRLSPENKLLWIYINLRCENSGIWIEDLETASFHLGSNYTLEEFKKTFRDQIIQLEDDIYFIPQFIINNHQNELTSNNVALKKVIPLLLGYDLIEKLGIRKDKNENDYQVYKLKKRVQGDYKGGMKGVEYENEYEYVHESVYENDVKEGIKEKKEVEPHKWDGVADLLFGMKYNECDNGQKETIREHFEGEKTPF